MQRNNIHKLHEEVALHFVFKHLLYKNNSRKNISTHFFFVYYDIILNEIMVADVIFFSKIEI